MDAKLKLTAKHWLWRLLGLSAIAGVTYAGYFVGFHIGLQDSYFNNLLHTQNYITTLNHIHQNKLDYASESLETNLSVSVLLSPPDDALMLPHTREMVQKTLGKVKAYRIKHPWQSDQPFDKRVEDKLSNIKPEAEKACP